MADHQLRLFEGDELKRAGIRKVVENNLEYVAEARELARRIAAEKGSVCSDDVQALYAPPPWAHVNVMGAIFSHRDFKFLRWIRSRRPSAHGRMIRLYTVESDNA